MPPAALAPSRPQTDPGLTPASAPPDADPADVPPPAPPADDWRDEPTPRRVADRGTDLDADPHEDAGGEVDDRVERPPKSAKQVLFDVAVAVGLVLAGVAAFAVLASLRTPPEPKDTVAPPPLVEVTPVTVRDGGIDVEADGVVVPYKEIAVAARVAGEIVETAENFRSGRYVEEGQTLLKIDPQNYENEVKRLKAELKNADAKLAELDVQIQNAEGSVKLAAADAKLAEQETERQQRLRSGGGGGTITAVEQARRNELAAKDKLQTAANQLRLLRVQRDSLNVSRELAQVGLERAELDLQRTTVTSAAAGVLVTTGVERGSSVQPGSALFTVDDTRKSEVRTNLRMKTLSWVLAHPPEGTAAKPDAGPDGAATAGAAYVLPDLPVTVQYELMGNTYAWDGVLSRVEGAGLDERTRTVPCRVEVPNPRQVSLRNTDGAGNAATAAAVPVAAPRSLVRGMYVTVLLHTDPADPLLEVPEAAVRPGNVVWVVRDGKLETVTVPVAAIENGVALVPPEAGVLKPGDRLVTTPLPAAVPGMTVRVAGAGVADDASGEGANADAGADTVAAEA